MIKLYLIYCRCSFGRLESRLYFSCDVNTPDTRINTALVHWERAGKVHSDSAGSIIKLLCINITHMFKHKQMSLVCWRLFLFFGNSMTFNASSKKAHAWYRTKRLPHFKTTRTKAHGLAVLTCVKLTAIMLWCWRQLLKIWLLGFSEWFLSYLYLI